MITIYAQTWDRASIEDYVDGVKVQCASCVVRELEEMGMEVETEVYVGMGAGLSYRTETLEEEDAMDQLDITCDCLESWYRCQECGSLHNDEDADDAACFHCCLCPLCCVPDQIHACARLDLVREDAWCEYCDTKATDLRGDAPVCGSCAAQLEL